ncbi:MAG TPA: SapC family protein [Burkholderiales bacterium]|nr:SapC family protein [Burkholderiales bacterium]
MQINPPFGYREVVPLQKTGGVALPAPGKLPEFCAQTNAMPVSYIEFAPAARDFPIVFASSDQGKTYAAVAVLGLAHNENLFVRNGVWEQGVYVPAYVRRYPFCMARVTMGNTAQENRLICVEKSFVSDAGEKMFDAEGKPTQRWTQIEQLLREYEADLERTRELCSILADYDLFEPFTMRATPAGGAQPLNLAGMYRVREDKLEHLNAAQHKNLFKKGIVGRIYAHLLSLESFGQLLARRVKLGPAPAQPAKPVEPAAKAAQPAAKTAAVAARTAKRA